MKKYFLFLTLSVLVISCGPRERVSRETFEQVNESMEVKRVTDVEITAAAIAWGDSIVSEARHELLAGLQKAIADRGDAAVLEFCNLQVNAILEAISEKHQVSLRRVSSAGSAASNLPDADEIPLLEAYEYAAENRISSEPNIQKVQGGELLLYTAPIVVEQGSFVFCPGEIGLEIDQATSEMLDGFSLLTSDSDPEESKLKGMWAVKIPKKEVVRRL